MQSSAEPAGAAAMPPSARGEGAVAPAPPRERWWSRITVTALVALVALAAGVVNLVFELSPGLRSDPGIHHSAQLTVLAMDKNVAYGDYARRPGAVAVSAPPPAGRGGNGGYLQVVMQGFKGKRARLRWFTYDSAGNRLPRPFSAGHSFRGKAPTDRSVSEEWIQLPEQTGTYRIRFQLYDADDVLLAYGDTSEFTTVQVP
jgi:hypothetical protein